MTELEQKDLVQIEEQKEVPCDVAADSEEVIETEAAAEQEEKTSKFAEKWQKFVGKHPKLEKVATYIKEHKTMLQAILFMLFSCLVLL